MRVLVELKAKANCVYDLIYHHKMQGFIYELLRSSTYGDLHDKRGYKFFCFSNIFPSVDMHEGDMRHFLVSSPDEGLIGVVAGGLEKLQHDKERVNIGEMSFSVENTSVLAPKIGGSCVLAAGTPIVVRIPKANYARYGIVPPQDYEYVYWRKQYHLETFVRQVEDSLFKKYNQYYGTRVEAFPIFEQFTFQKQVCNHLVLDGSEIKIFGTVWRFSFNSIDNDKRKFLQFALDVGLGELNSIGYGFMNLTKS
ncbi:MAG: CRISPR-associated endoribonuclease Cas6 [Candidatus Bathyarchaeia archaeon]